MLVVLRKMALLRYLKPVTPKPQQETTELPAPASNRSTATPSRKTRGEYTRLTPSEKAEIGRYASEHGVPRAVKHFSEKNVKESSIRDWKKLYEKELKVKLKEAEPGESATVAVHSLPSKRGKPPLLGFKLDTLLQERIVAMRTRGTPINSSIVVGTGRALLLKHNKALLDEFDGEVKLTKEWGRSILRRMCFTKRRANSKTKMLIENFAEMRDNYLIDIQSVIEMEDIPSDLVINWDQTAIQLVPSSSWTIERKGTKCVEISALNDKRQITAVFACTLSGSFLPIQLIYAGTTQKCLPQNVQFPDDWHITCSPNHWSNENTMIDYVEKIIIPYVSNKRKELGKDRDQSAVVIFDVFKGQCVENVFKLLDDNNILYVLVPANCTDKLQPLDLSVNKPTKDFMKSKFQEWYSEIIKKQLDDGIEEEVDMRLSIMKPLSARWIIELYYYLKSRPNIICDGFRAAGIC